VRARHVQTGLPTDAIVSNMTLRVVRLVREAYSECVTELSGEEGVEGAAAEAVTTLQASSSLHGLLLSGQDDAVPDLAVPFRSLKPKVITLINDELDDLKVRARARVCVCVSVCVSECECVSVSVSVSTSTSTSASV
jgi:hypothetical protein